MFPVPSRTVSSSTILSVMGERTATGVPRFVTRKDDPWATWRMTAAESFRNSLWLILFMAKM